MWLSSFSVDAGFHEQIKNGFVIVLWFQSICSTVLIVIKYSYLTEMVIANFISGPSKWKG